MLNIVIICGAPGCGKGTQSELIVEKYKLRHLSTGDLLRKEIAAKTELGLIADSYISKGELAPDLMIIDIIAKAIEAEQNDSKGIILDGFPRTIDQAVALERILNEKKMPTSVFVNLDVDNKELINRLIIRGETSGRSDDNLETVMKRLEVYALNTEPVIEHYGELNKLQTVNGKGSIEEVFARISQTLDTYIK